MKKYPFSAALLVLTALFTSFALSSLSACATEELADTLLTNGQIYGYPLASSLAISDGKIVHIGNSNDTTVFMTEHVGSQTRIIDLEGAYVMPGFIDNHNHVFEAAGDIGSDCLLDEAHLLVGYIAELKACGNQDTDSEWLLGYGHELDILLDYQSVDGGEQTPLEILDTLYPDRPVAIMEQTSHSMWVNSIALARAGITAKSTAPQGGKYLKDSQTGKLLGVLLDTAGDELMELAWNAQPNRAKANYQSLINGLDEAAKHGITSIGDGRLYWQRGWYETWQQVAKDNALTARVSLRPWVYPGQDAQKQLAFFKRIQTDDTHELLLVNQVKIYTDGIINNGTARVLSPYVYSPLTDSPLGVDYIPAGELSTWLVKLNNLGFGAHIHAIGDAGVRNGLDAIELMRKQGVTRPYGMTHLEMVADTDIPRFAALKVDADFQVGNHDIATGDHDWAIPYLGKQRAKALLPVQAIWQTGANTTLSSDWNVNDINPLVGISSAITMPRPLDINSAIDAYTINAAKALGLEKVTGSITLGKFADLAILDGDITKMTPTEIANTQLLMTLLEGEVVFEAQE
ncbi:amidohydrolase [Shewanella sp. SR44-3]|uniref:amidohydrolase n=1 Tax=Shewanella sp. SR44-3 TaxID=2760936 RepID=UPI0015FD9176|nr:amidohydrolase [Shewanella sp. SR44-3]MBB1269704.1 amidohydrolase [Shewanella sp. SR44-3]